MSVESGQTIDGKYKVGRLIGEGGMGTVYEGENLRIGRRVAIKVLHANVASMPEFAERFEREARVAARVGSPNVCDVLDLGDLPNGDRYIVMEFLDGLSFEDRIVQKGKLTPQELAPIAFELLEGLGTMHNARVVHRDLKPANVFLSRGPGGRGEIVKILDFGVAKLLPFEGEVGTMTKTGSMMGTPLYMSPEQARGARDVDGRTDLYAASVMFYRALCGQLPYMADTLNELLFKIVLEDPRPLVEVVPEIDEAFAAIVHKGLARDPDQRFSSAREYQEALAAWGKTQGRSSLQFAVTLPSDPPPHLSAPKISAAKAADSKPKAAPAVTGASTAAGTPIAWEGNGRVEGSETQVSGRAPMGSAPEAGVKSDPQKVISQPGSDVSPVASTVVSAGSPDIPAAQATTAPSAEQLAAKERAGSKNKLIMGAVAAVALCVGVGVVLAKSGSADPKTQGSNPPASVEGPKDPPPAPTTTATTAATTTATATSEPADTATPSPSTTPTTAHPTSTTVAIGGPKPTGQHGTGRTPDPKASTAPPATTSAPPATTAATPPSSSAKPASSARKFRTNID